MTWFVIGNSIYCNFVNLEEERVSTSGTEPFGVAVDAMSLVSMLSGKL